MTRMYKLDSLSTHEEYFTVPAKSYRKCPKLAPNHVDVNGSKWPNTFCASQTNTAETSGPRLLLLLSILAILAVLSILAILAILASPTGTSPVLPGSPNKNETAKQKTKSKTIKGTRFTLCV